MAKMIRLKIVEEPKPGSSNVLTLREGMLPALEGPGTLAYRCGQCNSIMTEGIYLPGVVIRCPNCQHYNQTPGS